jgi:ABC-type lipoprotein export system ATPase subunit
VWQLGSSLIDEVIADNNAIGSRAIDQEPVQLADVVVDVPGRRILAGISLTVRAGESVAVVGPSGSGKTTLLNCIAGLTAARSGKVTVVGEDMTAAHAARVAALRLRAIGIVFQFGELLPELNVVENVALPALFMRRRDAYATARQLLQAVNMAGSGERSTDSLSGGETQRVAVARALVNEPVVVLADEPTGALDEDNARVVTQLLSTICKERQTALIVATHDPLVAQCSDRILRLGRGHLTPEELVSSSEAARGACPPPGV